eukprot:1779372-Ditylum_brightwellii.AAC.1
MECLNESATINAVTLGSFHMTKWKLGQYGKLVELIILKFLVSTYLGCIIKPHFDGSFCII